MLSWQDMLKKYSTWVVGLLMAAVAYWFTLTAEEQKALQAAYPWLTQLSPLAGFVAFYFARAKTQGGTPPEEPKP